MQLSEPLIGQQMTQIAQIRIRNGKVALVNLSVSSSLSAIMVLTVFQGGV
jgi:hypothetical protein